MLATGPGLEYFGITDISIKAYTQELLLNTLS